ncbi:MAG TPA: hypothetical protein VGH13_10615 [Xanthobacteraceae bacterium]
MRLHGYVNNLLFIENIYDPGEDSKRRFSFRLKRRRWFHRPRFPQHNDIVVSMITAFDPSTGYLPPGVHDVAWAVVVSEFGSNAHRLGLLNGLLEALRNLAGAGCRWVLLDGSFVSRTALPKDYDGAWEPAGVDPARLDPVSLDFSNGRAAMKARYGGELFPLAAAGILYRDFFQQDRNGVRKGVVQIGLGSLP